MVVLIFLRGEYTGREGTKSQDIIGMELFVVFISGSFAEAGGSP